MPVSSAPRHPYRPQRQDPIQEVVLFHQEVVKLHNAGIHIAKLALDFVRAGGQCDRQILLNNLGVLNEQVQAFKKEIDVLELQVRDTNDHINGADRTVKALELGMSYQGLIARWTEHALPIVSSIQAAINQPQPQQGFVNV